jgi:hypothetical protein
MQSYGRKMSRPGQPGANEGGDFDTAHSLGSPLLGSQLQSWIDRHRAKQAAFRLATSRDGSPSSQAAWSTGGALVQRVGGGKDEARTPEEAKAERFRSRVLDLAVKQAREEAQRQNFRFIDDSSTEPASSHRD